MQTRDGATDLTVAHIFARVRSHLRKVQHSTKKLKFFIGEILMDLNEELNTSLDNMQTAIDDAQLRVQNHAAAQQAIIDDLKAQIAAGTPGLTAEQATALLERLVVLQADVQTTADEMPATDDGTNS